MKKNYPARLLAGLLTVVLPLGARAQTPAGVGIGTTTPDASAALEIKATDKGLLPPRLTAAQRAAIGSPAQGLLVYQTDGTSGYYYFNGQSWLNLTSGTLPNASGSLPEPATSGLVSTLAGTGTAGSFDGPATTATFSLLRGVAVDASGTVYIADAGNNRIRLIRGGVVSTLAGSVLPGFSDGAAASAHFNSPDGVAVNAAGTAVYVADRNNRRIRLIENGQVSTLAGSGGGGAADGPAATASFNLPNGVAVDAQGRVYVTDYGNNKIRLIENGQVSTLAGTGTAGSQDGPVATATLSQPSAVAVDVAGTVYVADSGNKKIRLIRNGMVSTLAGSGDLGAADGPAATATFATITAIAVDERGTVYVADAGNNRIRLIRDGQVRTLAGGSAAGAADGPAATATFNVPAGVAVDQQQNVYVGDYANSKVRLIGGAKAPPATLRLSGQTLSVVGGNSVTLPAEAQTLSLSGSSLSISGGNAVALPVAGTQQVVYSGTTPATAGGSNYIAFTIDPAKVVGLTAMVASSTGDRMPPGYTALSNNFYNVYVVGQQVRIDVTSNSANVLGRPIKVVLIYEP